MKKIAFYPGSFDPFTNGHLDVVKRASELFDEVHIVLAINTNKERTYNVDEMRKAINKTLDDHYIYNCKVDICFELIVDMMECTDAKYLIRGIRDDADYNYEEKIAKINQMINPKVETIYFRANSIVSSTMVKELFYFGKDVSEYVPRDVLAIMNEGKFEVL